MKLSPQGSTGIFYIQRGILRHAKEACEIIAAGASNNLGENINNASHY